MNAALGVLLWFGYCTDFSWAGTFADYCFPPGVAVVAAVSWWLFQRDKRPSTGVNRRVFRLACLPSLFGGGLAVMLMVIMMIPPFTLGFLFALSEIQDEALIQRVTSPDRSRVAEVHFRGVGTYAGGNGRVFIRVRYWRLPLVERDVYEVSRSYASKETREYVRWEGPDTLRIVGEPEGAFSNQEIKVGILAFRTPTVFSLPARMVSQFFR